MVRVSLLMMLFWAMFLNGVAKGQVGVVVCYDFEMADCNDTVTETPNCDTSTCTMIGGILQCLNLVTDDDQLPFPNNLYINEIEGSGPLAYVGRVHQLTPCGFRYDCSCAGLAIGNNCGYGPVILAHNIGHFRPDFESGPCPIAPE